MTAGFRDDVDNGSACIQSKMACKNTLAHWKTGRIHFCGYTDEYTGNKGMEGIGVEEECY